MKDAVVYLEGWIGSRRQKWEAEDTAWEVRGVKDVINRLRIEPAPEQEPRQAGEPRARRT